MMPRHAPGYAMAMLMALAFALFSPAAEAQLPPSQYDRLQRMLEDKFAPPKKPAPPTPGTSKADDFIYVEPDDKTKKSSSSEQKRSDVSDASWTQSLYSFFSRQLGGEAEPAQDRAVAAANTSGPAAERRSREVDSKTEAVRERVRKRRAERRRKRRAYHRRPERGSRAYRRDRVPVAKPNSYVIQLTPDADADGVDALLAKYGFTVTKTIAPLGVITVQLDASGVRREAARAAPEPDVQDPKTKLQNILEPPLIKELREEKIVDAAFVNSVMEARHLPGPAGASINVDNEVFSWRWSAGEGEDGNWGLKQIRVPPVWTVLRRHRASNPDVKRPKIGIIDGGFAADPAVPFASMQNVRPLATHTAGCGTHHGMHVAGIIGAKQVDGNPGVDGIVPDARIDAIAIDDAIVGDSGVVGVDQGWQVHALLFDDVLARTLDYVYADMLEPDNLRVINISLGYNFVASDLLGDVHPQDVPGLGLHVMHQANLIRLMASRVQDRVLFVVAAGNDSDADQDPIEAKWASPFAWAATQPSAAGDSPSNILVVEAVDRDGFRADFSNIGGHVSAPGVDIMSTLDVNRMPFGVCSGTSQAAPYVAGLAAILFELAPDKLPADIAEVLRTTGASPLEDEENAPTVDALDAVVAVAPEKARLIADLDNDGIVGPSDLDLFARQLETVATAATANTAFAEDLNGDGVIDDNECFWPKIDLNGSGHGALTSRDARRFGGADLTDLAVIERFWSDPATPFGTAIAASGLATPAEIYTVAEIDPAPVTQCRRSLDTPLTVAEATTPAAPAGTDSGSSNALAATTKSGATGDVADAEAVRSEVEKAIEELRKTHPNLRVKIDPATGLPASVIGIAPLPGTTSIGSARSGDLTEEEVKRAVDAYFGQGGLGSLYPSQNSRVKTEYVGRRKDPDFPDRYVADVEQRIDGVPVFGSSAKLTVSRALGVTKYNGTTSSVAIENTTPKIAEGEAIAAARVKLADVLRSAPDASRAFPLAPDPAKADVGKPDLVVFDPALIGKASGAGRTRLAWLVTIDSFRIFVDAETGEPFYYYRDKPSGMLRKIFDLGQNTAFPGAVAIDEDASRRTEGLSPESLTAFRNAGIVRDYFFITFGRNSYDDNDGDGPAGGAPLEAYVRHGQTKNAYWCTGRFSGCPSANVMVYGPGYADALDIVAHEMTHGIIVHEKNLLYLNEPGAVNESLADIFGALIELEFKGEGGNWLIGEQTPGFSITQPLRSMADPNLRDGDGRPMFDRSQRFSLSNRGQPDHYSQVLTPDDTLCGSTAYNDNGCVHFNSGILNKFAYLVAEGGTHHGVTVNGIGTYKLARITYRAMTVGLNRSSTLSHAANAFVEGCFELASGSIAGLAQADCEQVMASQRAVGLDVPSS